MDTTKINEALDEKIPRDCVTTRDAGGNKKLSYLETHYVIDRMNKVLGNLSWSSETVEMKCVETIPPTYIAKVRIAVHGPQGGVLVVKEGYGWGADKPKRDGSITSPHEMAIKEAESDAFKRAAKNLGQSMGLALYDKTQENVEEPSPKPDTKVTRGVRAAAPKPVASEPSVTASGPVVATQDASIDDVIASISRVVIGKKKATVESLKQLVKDEFGVEHRSLLDTAGKEKLKARLEGFLNG